MPVQVLIVKLFRGKYNIKLLFSPFYSKNYPVKKNLIPSNTSNLILIYIFYTIIND